MEKNLIYVCIPKVELIRHREETIAYAKNQIEKNDNIAMIPKSYFCPDGDWQLNKTQLSACSEFWIFTKEKCTGDIMLDKEMVYSMIQAGKYGIPIKYQFSVLTLPNLRAVQEEMLKKETERKREYHRGLER